METLTSSEYPTIIYGKTIVLWACTVVIGQAVVFACVMGPLLWLDVIKRADGQPGSFGGIHMTVIGLILLPVAISFTFQLFARQWLIIKIYKEGLQIREIGTPLDIAPLLMMPGFNIFVIVLVSAWQLLTLQMFRVKTTRLHWEEITNVVPGHVSFSIYGSPTRETQEMPENIPVAPFVEFHYDEDSFGLPTEKVCEIVQYYRLVPNARLSLCSWNDDFSASRSFE